MLGPVFRVTCVSNNDPCWVGVKTLVVHAVLHNNGMMDGYPEWSEDKGMQRFLHRMCTFYSGTWHMEELREL